MTLVLDFNSHSALYHKKSKSKGNMRKKTKTWNKIKEPFKELGIELKGSSEMYEFEYNKAQMFLFVMEKDESISFAAYVVWLHSQGEYCRQKLNDFRWNEELQLGTSL